MFEPMVADDEPAAVIKVIGVGGGGGNAVEHMIAEHIEGVEFFAANTDAQALKRIKVSQTIQIGNNITKGLGAGANPEVGRNSAEEDRDVIRSAIEGADMVFIAAGMGGGTGTGAAPVVAEIAKELGILTVAVVTKPFGFEGKKRMAFAEQGIAELAKHVDSLITIPNDKLLKVLGRGVKLLDAFAAANGVLKGAVQGIAELITKPGHINVDFADVRTVMSEMGYAMMGSGRASGDNRAEEAAEMAISSPLLEDIDLSGARGVLVNVTAGLDLGLEEFETVGSTVRAFASDNATVVVGTTFDPDMSDEIRVTVVATGIGMDKRPEVKITKPAAQHGSLFGQTNHIPPQQEEPMPKVVNEPAVSPLEEHKILDIPAFIRKQAN
ncbi:Cell division GTPase [Gilliamella apicola SCGC AB-598-I20]|uniref:Cell division protein FtsZ n=2 Tax=Gilliamella apicola TaxID=1196095 RepID=A0A2V4DZA1_9GAMM|nr:cell division protein FtsZ [Gilliamella apicola]KES18549.1 Cell division GTPase [Gilliamella apicola SCGC AB-598-I20]PXZ05573.1 cell division protein FtsZ [Gilliamella apicola]PXZ08027.1 cell division protein FtsZ [Gilliamella apicola]